MKPTVLLFDIDGTLMDSGGAGRRSIDRAFERRHGRRDACAEIRFGGMTDRAIARAGLIAVGVEPTPAALDDLLAAYLEALVEELPASTAVVHAGIEAALEAGAAAGAAVGLGTGNLREGARLKLGRVGLADRFSFGGFGCDHETRSELLRVGAERGARALGAPVSACRVVIIGDTPKDVAAAQAIGAECIAVATGTFSAEELLACGPTRVFRDLDEDGALAALLAR
jgi:phosphoglycolate phosphatase-like HAD superfamily hydrolase